MRLYKMREHLVFLRGPGPLNEDHVRDGQLGVGFGRLLFLTRPPCRCRNASDSLYYFGLQSFGLYYSSRERCRHLL